MKNELNLKGIGISVILLLFIVGCASDDPEDSNNSKVERTKVIMNIPNGTEDINWGDTELIWSEEFNESSTVEDLWNFESDSVSPGVADQLQVYSKKNVEISNGTLKIHARKIGEGQNKGDYTSARINSKYEFQYGRIEVSAKLPGAEKSGLWAKIALIGSNIDFVGAPESGEINIMEYLSYRPNEIYITVHSSVNNSDNGSLLVANEELITAEEEFHAYGLLWTDKYLKFYIDDPDDIIYTLNRPAAANQENWPFDQPFWLLMHLVVGGNFADSEGVDDSMFPVAMEIDYIKVYHAK